MAVKLNRDQLYTMAAKASFGKDQELALDVDGYPERLVIAIKVRDNAPQHQKQSKHKNGWAYFQVDPEGHLRAMEEGEV